MDDKINKPKLGLALSGAAARSAFYIGFLEVLKENQVKIDYIAAQSGATIVATSFACGTMDKLKEDLFTMDYNRARKLVFSKMNGGMFSLDEIEKYGADNWSYHKTFEEVDPKLVFIATDLGSGLPVRLEMGDIAKACRYSCTVPGLFSPKKWGNKVLVDGGLVSFIPAQFVRESGADVVVGVSVRATKHIFPKMWQDLRVWYNWIRRRTVFPLESRFLDVLEPLYLSSTKDLPGSFAILGRALDIAISAGKKSQAEEEKDFGCDLLVEEGRGDFGGSVKIKDMKSLYKAGRESAKKALPEIKKLLIPS